MGVGMRDGCAARARVTEGSAHLRAMPAGICHMEMTSRVKLFSKLDCNCKANSNARCCGAMRNDPSICDRSIRIVPRLSVAFVPAHLPMRRVGSPTNR